MSNVTHITPNGLMIGTKQILLSKKLGQAIEQLGGTIESLNGLKLNTPQRIIFGGEIGYRPENTTVSIIDRQSLPKTETQVAIKSYKSVPYSCLLRELDRARYQKKMEELDKSRIMDKNKNKKSKLKRVRQKIEY